MYDYASNHRNIEMIRYLVEEVGCDVLALNNQNFAPFDIAARNGFSEIAEYLISKGIPPFALHTAANMGLMDIATYLLSRGCCVNKVSESHRDFFGNRGAGHTPLHEAIIGQQSEMAKFLIKNGANPNLGNNPQTPLHLACKNGDYELVKLLTSEAARLDAVEEEGNTALHYAVAKKYRELTLLLLELGANTSILNHEKQSAFDLVCQTDWIDVLHMFISKENVVLNKVDVFGYTALVRAISFGRSEVALLLLSLGADPSILTNQKWNALHMACKQGLVDVVKALIGTGMKLNERDENGCTPLGLVSDRPAQLERSSQIRAILREHGAIRLTRFYAA